MNMSEFCISSREVVALIKLHLKSTSEPSVERLTALINELKCARERECVPRDA